MGFSFALQICAVTLLLICITLVPSVFRRDPAPVISIIKLDTLPQPQWPGALTRVGLVSLLVGFMLLIATCYLMLN